MMISKDAVINSIANQFIERAKNDGVSLNFKEIQAINFLTKKLIEYNLWDKFVAIYPFVGRSAITHAYNLKNILRHTIRWFNTSSLVHDENGVTNINNGYGNTFVAPSIFSDNNIHVSVYSTTFYPFLNPYSPIIGSSRNPPMNPGEHIRDAWIHTIWLKRAVKEGSFTYSSGPIGNGSMAQAGEDAGDFLSAQVYGYIVGVNKTRCFLNGKPFGYYEPSRNGVSIPINPHKPDLLEGTTYDWTPWPFMLFTNRSFGETSDTVTFGKFENRTTYSVFANANIRFATLGYSLTVEDNKFLYDIVEEFQSILGRNVGEINITPDIFKVEEQGLSVNLNIDSIKMMPAYFTQGEDGHGFSFNLNIDSLKVVGPRRVYVNDTIGFGATVLSFEEIS